MEDLCRTEGIYNDGIGHIWIGGTQLNDDDGSPTNPSVEALSGTGSQPSVLDGILVAGGGKNACGGTGAADVKSGDVLWRANVGGCGSAISGGLMVTSDGFHLYGLDLTTGKERWTYPDEKVFDHVSELGANATTVFTNRVGNITALDAATGKQLWSQPESVPQQSPFTVSETALYYHVGYGSGDVEVVARSMTDGSILWRTATPASKDIAITLANGLLYTGGMAIHVTDAADGKLIRTIELPKDQPGVAVGPVIPINGHLYVGTSNGIFDYVVPTD